MRIGERIARARRAAGKSQAELAKAVNQAQTTVSSWERGRTEPTREDVARVAEALGIPRIGLEADESLIETAPVPVVRRVPVVGNVQAGAWVEHALSLDSDEPEEWVPFDEPEYRRAKLFSLRVMGPSANLFYPEGVKVVCAVPAEAGVREGDFVVAQRQRGGLFETTLKQVQVGADGGLQLWPRSTHPDFQEPITFAPRDEFAQDGVEIIGVVVAKVEVGRSGQGPLLEI